MRKYPSPSDINDMKAKGYCSDTIALEIEKLSIWQEIENVKNIIIKSFADVKLGNGVGLFEAQAIDDYADIATREKYREKDEKLDWTKISANDLSYCNSSLSFFDAEGMRFNLPAYLIAELSGDYNFSLVFDLSWHESKRFSLFNKEQKNAVLKYLYLIAEHPDYSYQKKRIMEAIKKWSNQL